MPELVAGLMATVELFEMASPRWRATAPQLGAGLARARLWWIGADVCDLIDQAAPTMPPQQLTEDMLPNRSGFVCFERRMTGSCPQLAGERVPIDFMHWYPVRDGVALVQWSYTTTAERRAMLDPDPRLAEFSAPGWDPNDWDPADIPPAIATEPWDWPYGVCCDDLDADHLTRLQRGSIIEDRRRLAALWLLSAQTVAGVSDVEADRATRRRLDRLYERAGRDLGSLPAVRLVRIKPPAPRPHWAYGAATGVLTPLVGPGPLALTALRPGALPST